MTWFYRAEFPQNPLYGIHVRTLCDKRGLDPVAAFLTADWAAREPQAARKALSTGYDTLRFVQEEDKVVELVGEYEQEVLEARKNPDVWMNEKIENILEEKTSCMERCNALYKVRLGLAALEISASKSKEEATEEDIEDAVIKYGEDATLKDITYSVCAGSLGCRQNEGG